MSVIPSDERERNERFFKDYMEERRRVLARAGRFQFNDADLRGACEALELEGASAAKPNSDFYPPDPREKARKNYIDGEALKVIEEDLKYSPDVAEYIDNQAVYDDEFPERLRSNFLKVYDECVGSDDGDLGNGVFWEIVRRLAGKMPAGKNRFSIEVLLVHYFSFCEVFPKDGPGTAETERRKR